MEMEKWYSGGVLAFWKSTIIQGMVTQENGQKLEKCVKYMFLEISQKLGHIEGSVLWQSYRVL